MAVVVGCVQPLQARIGHVARDTSLEDSVGPTAESTLPKVISYTTCCTAPKNDIVTVEVVVEGPMPEDAEFTGRVHTWNVEVSKQSCEPLVVCTHKTTFNSIEGCTTVSSLWVLWLCLEAGFRQLLSCTRYVLECLRCIHVSRLLPVLDTLFPQQSCCEFRELIRDTQNLQTPDISSSFRAPRVCSQRWACADGYAFVCLISDTPSTASLLCSD